VAALPDMLFGQFFCECHRHNAEMTPALHFAQWLSSRSWDAILSNVFVNYVYNVLTLQYQTMPRQIGSTQMRTQVENKAAAPRWRKNENTGGKQGSSTSLEKKGLW